MIESSTMLETIDPSQRRSILLFAALGMVSGALSYLAGKYASPDVLRFSLFFGWGYGGGGPAPILPGVIFGLLVAACCHRFGGKHPALLIVAVLLTTAAWILAWDATVEVDGYLEHLGEPSAMGVLTSSAFRGTASFAVGGLVGGLGTCLAVATANARFRRLEHWLLTLAVATFFGAIEQVYDLLGEAGLLALFVAWQAAVIASIARALVLQGGKGAVG
jgi:hypothetical protein